MAYTDAVKLIGCVVRLEPLGEEHAEALLDALDGDEEVWRYLPEEMPHNTTEMRSLIDTATADATRLPFVVIDQASDGVIGSTSFYRADEKNRGIEIGGTWYKRAYWRSAVNTECKYLLLRHAFEELGCIRVALRTDERNVRSRAAIQRIGGVFEGIARKDRLVKGGWQRSSAFYSLISEEWPERKAWFEERLSI